MTDETAMGKRFALKPEDILPLAEGHGGCIATDMILVDGKSVGYMVREAPVDPADSGWYFMAGDESQAYMDEPNHHGIYDVNTIANYCPEIIPLLDTPAPCAFARDDQGKLVAVPYEAPED